MDHIVVGTDIMLGNLAYLCIGYNFKRASDMKLVDDSSHGAGLSLELDWL